MSRAVILAAGAGRRLQPLVGPRPKCLARVGGCTLIERQIRALRAHGVGPVAVVVGYGRDEVEAACGSDIDFVHNPDHASTNSLYSLWLARDLLADGFMVLNADVLFHPVLLSRLLDAPYEDVLLLSPRRPDTRYSDEEMKVQVRGGCVAAIDKALPDGDTDGENVGIARFGATGAALLLDEVNALIRAGAVREWLPRAFDAFCRKRPLHVVDTAGYPWIEIDFPEDYRRACADVLPALTDDAVAAARAGRFTAETQTAIGRMLHRV